MHNVVVTCKNQTITAYPSCPAQWTQKETNCYYFGTEPKSWVDSKTTCEQIWQGLAPATPASEEQLEQLAHNYSHMWTVMEPCTLLSTANVSAHNCCSPTTDMSQQFAVCPAEQKWPFICQTDVQAITAKVTNISMTSLPNNSVVISWDATQGGWNVLWRTLTVYSKQGDLLSTTIVPHFNNRATLPPLDPGAKYNIKIWPHKDGKLQSDTAASFALLNPRSGSETNGGVLQLPLSVNGVIHWEGWLRIQWTPAIVRKDNTVPFSSDGYRLAYGLDSENRSNFVEVNETNNVYHDLDDVHANRTYKFSLSCIFGNSEIVPCGKLAPFTINLPTKIWHGQTKYRIYDVYNGPDSNQTWSEAENNCSHRNGHLVSVGGKLTDSNLRGLMVNKTPHWIGAINCDSKSGVKWSDGSNWTYIGPIIDKTPKGNACCISATPASGNNSTTSWDYTDCNATLPYVCQSTVADLGILQNFSINLPTFTTFQIQWKTSNRLLTVASYSAELCGINSSLCTVMAANVTSSPIYLRSLDTNTKYLVRVNATLQRLSYVVSVNATATTGNKLDVSVNVSTDGHVKLRWPCPSVDSKAAIVYIISPNDKNVNAKFPLKDMMSDVNKTNIMGLPYGYTYNLNLIVIENGTDHVIDTIPFTINTKPNCTRNEFQFESSCYWIGKVDATWDEGSGVCREGQGQMALTTTADKIRFFREIAAMVDTPLWVEGKTSALLHKSPDAMVLIHPGRVKRSTGCRVISHEAEDDEDIVGVEQCVKRYPVLCERKLKVQLGPLSPLIIKDITTTSITLQWSSTSWKPTNYNITTTTVSQPSRVKRAPVSQPFVAIGNEVATITGLQPHTEYKIDVTPSMVVNGQIPKDIVGDTATINVHTLDPNSTSTPRALEMTAGQMDTTSNINSGNGSTGEAGDGNSVRNDQLWVFRIIGCSVLIGLVTLSILIFTFCSMFQFRDCLCEMCFEVSLLVAHVLILVDVHTVNQIDCRVTAICIHYFFTSCFLFFALQTICHVKTMTKLLPIAFLCHGWQLFILGWGVPIVIVIVTSTTISDQYVVKETDHYCWLNLDSDAMLATVIPIGIFVGVALLGLLIAICGRPDDNYEVDEESFTRYEPMQDQRWILLFIFSLLVSHWAVGMVATHNRDGNLYIAFIVLSIVLGISILMLRCIGDDEIRLKIRTCCKGSPVEPMERRRGKFLSSQDDLRHAKGVFHSTGRETDGTLIIKRTYIYRP